jgi:molybdopterin synthase catalytic subunit
MSHAIHIDLVDEPIVMPSSAVLAKWMGDTCDPDVGSIVWFFGVTRRNTGARVTDTLFYEAHRPMARKSLEELAEQSREKFDLRSVVIVHRLGEVPVGQASVLVGCSSSHRRESFEALAWIMDELKRVVPIWKRECYADGTNEWVHPAGA